MSQIYWIVGKGHVFTVQMKNQVDNVPTLIVPRSRRLIRSMGQVLVRKL